MNRQMWNLYKESERGKKCIEMFNPETEDIYSAASGIFEFSHKTDSLTIVKHTMAQFDIFCGNFSVLELISRLENCTRKDFAYVMENYELRDFIEKEDGSIELCPEAKNIIIAKEDYRKKANLVQAMSVFLYLGYGLGFKPISIRHVSM